MCLALCGKQFPCKTLTTTCRTMRRNLPPCWRACCWCEERVHPININILAMTNRSWVFLQDLFPTMNRTAVPLPWPDDLWCWLDAFLADFTLLRILRSDMDSESSLDLCTPMSQTISQSESIWSSPNGLQYPSTRCCSSFPKKYQKNTVVHLHLICETPPVNRAPWNPAFVLFGAHERHAAL